VLKVVRWSIIIVAFVVGLLMPYFVLRWGWQGLSGSIVFLIAPGITLRIWRLYARAQDGGDDGASGTSHIDARLVLRAVLPLALAALVGAGTSFLGTEQPYRVVVDEDTQKAIPYASDPFSYDVYLKALTECTPGHLTVWGSREYEMTPDPADPDTVIEGTDVVGWEGVAEDITTIPHEPEIWGWDEEVEGGTERWPAGATCGRSGRTVVWGWDSVAGEGEYAVWTEAGDGRWTATTADLPDEQIVAMVQSSPTSAVHVISVARGDSSSERAVLRCGVRPRTDGAERLLDTSVASPVIEMRDGEEHLSTAIRGSHLYHLVGRIAGERAFEDLRILETDGCDGDVAVTTLRRADGTRTFEGAGPQITVGPGGTVLLSSFYTLEVMVLRDGTEVGSVRVDVGFDPDHSGIYGWAPSRDADRPYALLWAQGGPSREGQAAENHIVQVEWEPEDRLCIRATAVCRATG
jgi:hypothetical protein